MLRITTESTGKIVLLKVEGSLAGPCAEEFRRAWTAAVGAYKGLPLVVELTGMTFIDSPGKELLHAVHHQGGRLVGAGIMAKSLIGEITGEASAEEGSRRTGNTRSGIIKSFIMVLVLPLLAMSRAEAQEKPPIKLTLREAVQLALKENPRVRIANLNTAESAQEHDLARAALLPQAGIEVYDKVQRFNLEAFIGKPLPGSTQHAGPFQTFQAGTAFSMPIFDLTLWRRWQASHQGVKAGEAQESTVREQMVMLVVSQYLGSLRASANVRAAQSRVELAQALYDQAADLQAHGVGTGLDALRSNVQLQNEKQRLIVAETQQRTSLYGLVRLLNLEARQSVELADEMSFFETPEFPADQSLERAFATRPEVKALDAREQMVRAQQRAAGESRLPKLLFGGSWGYQGLSLPSAIPSYAYQITVDVPLFTSGRIRAEITKAGLELKKVAQEKEDLRSQIALEVKTALAELEAARHEVEVANLGVKLAEEEVSQSRDRFQAGVANNIEVVTAQDAFARANDNQIAALYRYNQSRADLAHAIGQMEGLYTK